MITKQITILGAFLVMAACAYGQDVHYNYDRSANFAGFKTYQWLDIPGGAVPDPLIDQKVMTKLSRTISLIRVSSFVAGQG